MTTETALRERLTELCDADNAITEAEFRVPDGLHHEQWRLLRKAVHELLRVAALTPRADYGITLDPAEADGPTMPPNTDELAPAQRLRSREHANRIIVKSGPPPPPEGPATLDNEKLFSLIFDTMSSTVSRDVRQTAAWAVYEAMRPHVPSAPTPTERG